MATPVTETLLRLAAWSGHFPRAFSWKAVGRRIRELRGFDMSQTEFARRIGVSQGHLSYIERGDKTIGVEILLKIHQEFGKSIE